MPKERLHLLIADESLRALHREGRPARLAGDFRSAFLLGSISPDLFFYDALRFRLNRVGDELHRLEGEAGVVFFKQWLEEKGDEISTRMQAWTLGMVGHFVTDALWHPLITHFSNSVNGFCHDWGYSPRHCHHWLESELEALWLERMAAHDAYRPFLEEVVQDAGLIAECAGAFEEILIRLGIRRPPANSRIRRCFLQQSFLLRQFCHPIWMGQRKRLLARDCTRLFGALVTPRKSSLPELLSAEPSGKAIVARLCDEKLMKKTISLLSNRFSELPARL